MNIDLMKEKCEEVSALLKQFAHPQRLLILCHLSEGEKPVSELQALTGISQSQTSQFLKRMENEDLLSSRRHKNYTYYRIANPDVKKLLKSMQKIFC